MRLAELQVLAELVWERRATTTELAWVMQRTDAEARIIRPHGRTRLDRGPRGGERAELAPVCSGLPCA